MSVRECVGAGIEACMSVGRVVGFEYVCTRKEAVADGCDRMLVKEGSTWESSCRVVSGWMRCVSGVLY